MKYLNLCCGSVRDQSDDWINIDHLLPVLGKWSPEWAQLLTEKNYIEHDITASQIPFEAETFDGILMSHCLEHWDCQQGVKIMQDCRRALKPGGILLVSVPDASYFRKVYDRDTVENAVELFGEPIHLPDGETTFLGYGLWNRYHKAILTEDSLWAYFVRAGFKEPDRIQFDSGRMVYPSVVTGYPLDQMVDKLNRIPFSLCMFAAKE